MQVAVLAIADAAFGKRALTSTPRHPGVLIEGVLLVLVLATAAAGITVGDRTAGPIGLWSSSVLVLVILSLYIVKRYESAPAPWQPSDGEERETDARRTERREKMRSRMSGKSTTRLTTEMVLAAGAVLVAGFSVAKAGDQIAEQTGIGGSFVGAALMPIATSLPELSTTIAAVRIGAPVMAISNIFGTNLFDAGLLSIIDVAYPGPPVLNEVGRFSQVGALLGMVCTLIYLAGILHRRERTFMRLGVDSIAVVIVYLGGLVLLYMIRGN